MYEVVRTHNDVHVDFYMYVIDDWHVVGLRLWNNVPYLSSYVIARVTLIDEDTQLCLAEDHDA